jgi:hypothetical protein
MDHNYDNTEMLEQSPNMSSSHCLQLRAGGNGGETKALSP